MININKKNLKKYVKFSQYKNSILTPIILAPMFLKCAPKETSGDAENRIALRRFIEGGKSRQNF